MPLPDFHVSEPFTLGIELEMQVVNPPGYDLSQDSSMLIDAVKNKITAGEVKHDITESMLELATDVCRDINQAAGQFSAMQKVVLQAACKKYGTFLICDEIQCGYGRSGKFFAHQWLGIKPDLITVAKGIGNGFPMGGVLISPEFTPVYGQLGTTFGGNHLACTAALAVLDVFEKENLVENAHEVGEYLIAQLKELQKRNSHITEVRGRGLMVGAVLDIPHKEVRSKLIHEQHCFTGCAGTNILRILPPLVLTKENVDDFIGRLETVLKEV